MKTISVPSCSNQLIKVAAIIRQRHATVRCPPAPLQCALLACQAHWDEIAKLVYLRRSVAGRQVVTLRMKRIDRLAICSGIVGDAVSGRLRALQYPLVQASIGISCGSIDALVANLHLKMTEVMRCDHMLELHYLTTSVSCCRASVDIQI